MILPLFFQMQRKSEPEIMDREHNNLLKESFRIFYENHSAGFLNFIRKACGGDEGIAGDIFQESFFRLFRSSPRGLNEYQLKSYLYKTAYRLVIDEKRKRTSDSITDEMTYIESKGVNNADLSIDLERIFGKLKKKERSLLWLAYVEGYSHREISEVTDIKEKSLKVVLFRLRKKCAEILRAEGFSYGGTNE